MKNIARLVLPFLLMPTVALAQADNDEVVTVEGKSARPSKPSLRINVPDYSLTTQIYDFPTGLRIMMQPDSSHPIVTVFSIVNHGSSDDPEGKEGTAHFVEHTWFRSVHGDLPPIMQVVQDLGSLFNATTRADYTDYRTVTSSEYLPALLKLESLRLTEPYIGVTEDQIETEREVIRNEWRRRNEQSQALLFDYLFSAVYPEDHPYAGRSTHESLDNIKLADLQKYMDDYYHPQNTTTFVVGDFEPWEGLSLIFENYDLSLLHPDLTEQHLFQFPKPGIESPDAKNPDHWLTGAYVPETYKKGSKDNQWFVPGPSRVPRINEDRPPTPPLGSAEVMYREGALDNQTVAIGWSLPGSYREDQLNLQFMGNIGSYTLNAGLNGYGKRLGDKGCFVQPGVLASTMMCYVEVKDSALDPEDIAEKALDQLANIWNPELVMAFERDISKARQQMLAQTLQSLDIVAQHFGGRAEDITPYAHFTARATAHSDTMNRVSAIKAQTIANMASKYLLRGRAAILVVDPLPDDEIDVEGEASSYHGASASDLGSAKAKELASVTDQAIADSFVKPNLDDLQQFKLQNGMKVIVLPHGEAPVLEASIVLGGGSGELPHGIKRFVDTFSTTDLHEAARLPTSEYDPLQIGGFLTGQNYYNWQRSGLRASAGNLDGALWLLRQQFDSWRPEMGFKPAWLKNRKSALKSGWYKASWHVSRLQSEHNFPDHPAGHVTSWDDVKTWSEWGSGTVSDYIKRHTQPANMTLFIVGNVDGESARQLAAKYFSSYKPTSGIDNAPVARVPTPSMPSGRKVFVFDEPKRTQTQIYKQCRLNYNGTGDQPTVSVLGSMMSDKTFSQLRVKEALAYSPNAAARSSENGSATLMFFSLAVNQGVGRTVEVFDQLVSEAEAGEFDQNLVTLHKLRKARNGGVASQSTDQMLNNLLSAYRYDLPIKSLLDRGDNYAAVNKSAMQQMIKGCNERAIITMQGPKDIITAQLDEKGIAYEVLDQKDLGDKLLEANDPKAYKKKMKKRAKSDAKKAKEDGEAPEDAETSEEGENTDEGDTSDEGTEE